jgi:penicillin-binding protein 1C
VQNIYLGKHGYIQAAGLTALISGLIIGLLFAFSLPAPPFPDDYSLIIRDEQGETIRVFLNSDDQWQLPPELDGVVPEKLLTAVMFYEDKYFYRHPGFNPLSLLRASAQNLFTFSRISGASTITMQVARIAVPKERTPVHKILEIMQSIVLEIRYSKPEIIKLYLDHAPYGGNIIGYQTASWKYFGKTAQDLTWAEASLLAILPNSPGLIYPGADSGTLKQKRDNLLMGIKNAGIIDNETLSLATKEPIPQGTLSFPITAPHLTGYIREMLGTSPHIVQSTVNAGLQKKVESLVRSHTEFLQNTGIDNLAVLIAETESGKVRVYLGSQNFYDTERQGQVDGIRAYRSTGSLLKPFLFALAMDEGLILPETMNKDIPTQYGAFAPQNADYSFRGLVSSSEALIKSLNVPAARLLNAYGLDNFYLFLKSAGMEGLFRNADDYGIPLILGGAEATPWELCMLFRGLARGGVFTSPTLLEDRTQERSLQNPSENPSELISPGACYLTLDILRDLKRPGTEYFWTSFQDHKPIAWKTGTSYGQRDGWAVGVNPDWTIVVWTGNFSGEENANLRSTKTAAPILFDIFNSLPELSGKNWFSISDGILNQVELCLDTGFRATEHCTNTVIGRKPAGSPPLPECPYHRTIYVTKDGNSRVHAGCWEPGNYNKQRVLIFPADVTQYLRDRGQRLDRLPPFKDECLESYFTQSLLGDSSGLSILYPQDNAKLFIPRELDGSLQKVTVRAGHREDGIMLYWYKNKVYQGFTMDDHVMALSFEEGQQSITVIDEMGVRASVEVHIGQAR